MIGPTLMSMLAFIVFGATKGSLTAQDVFSALVYFNMIRLPLLMLPNVCPHSRFKNHDLLVSQYL
jgi:hypothetical protein